MTWRPQRLVKLALTVIGLGVAHHVLLHALAERNVVAVLLSAGAHSPPSALLLAGLFLVVRVLAVLVLPASVLCRLSVWGLQWWRRRQAG